MLRRSQPVFREHMSPTLSRSKLQAKQEKDMKVGMNPISYCICFNLVSSSAYTLNLKIEVTYISEIFNGLQGVISQKIELFATTASRISDPTFCQLFKQYRSPFQGIAGNLQETCYDNWQFA